VSCVDGNAKAAKRIMHSANTMAGIGLEGLASNGLWEECREFFFERFFWRENCHFIFRGSCLSHIKIFCSQQTSS
jgi:hypothetical protein